MLIVGEKINSTRKSISRAVDERDADIIRKEAVKQVQAGAHTLDVNCGTLPAEMNPTYSHGWSKQSSPWWICLYAWTALTRKL